MRPNFVQILLGAFLLVLVPNFDSEASSRILPLHDLERRGYPTTASELAKFLDEKSPESTFLKPSLSDPLREPWSTNSTIVAALAELNARDYAPTLERLISRPLPQKLNVSLTAYACSGIAWDARENRLDKNCANALVKFRGDCAITLAKLGASQSLPTIENFIATNIATVPSWWVKPMASDALWGFSSACKAASVLGSKKGIDAAIATLPALRPHSPEMAVDSLRLVTGQTFGPEFGMPASEYAREIQKWSDWWNANRESFTCDLKLDNDALRAPLPPIAPDTLYNRLLIAHMRLMDFDGITGGKEQASWLEQHAGEHVDELERIIGDRAANFKARSEAIGWYAEVAGARALPLLTQCFTMEIAHDPEDAELAQILLLPAARDAIQKYMPSEMDAATVACLERAPKDSLVFGPRAMNDARVAAAVVKRFSRASQAEQLDLVQSIRDAPRDAALSVYIQAIKQELDARTARYGLEGITRLGAEPELDTEAQAAAERWRNDPYFESLALSDEINNNGNVTPRDLTNIATRIEGSGPTALRLHYVLFQTLGRLAKTAEQSKQKEFLLLRDEMWKDFTRDVASLGGTALLNVPTPPETNTE